MFLPWHSRSWLFYLGTLEINFHFHWVLPAYMPRGLSWDEPVAPKNKHSSGVRSGSKSKFCLLESLTVGPSASLISSLCISASRSARWREELDEMGCHKVAIGSRSPDPRRGLCSVWWNALCWWFSEGKVYIEALVIEDKEKILGLLFVFISIKNTCV